MKVEVTQIEALEDRAQYAERRLRHCKQWYAERLERLTAYAKENGIWPDVARIIANGSLSDGTRYDPPTYAQQMNTAIHRAEAAEDRASKLQGTVDTLESQIAELRKDRERLDFLDQCNKRLNARYGTDYGWQLILNHNVNRLMLGNQMNVDLHDSHGGKGKLPSCRAAIDKEMERAAALQHKEPKP